MPLKVLLAKGLIKATPEAIFIALNRSPAHLIRSKAYLLSAIESLYWAAVDAAHAALMAAKQIPPSPEQIGFMLNEVFVKKKLLDKKYVSIYNKIYSLAHAIVHGEVKEIKGSKVDEFYNLIDSFVREMAKLINRIVK